MWEVLCSNPTSLIVFLKKIDACLVRWKVCSWEMYRGLDVRNLASMIKTLLCQMGLGFCGS